MKSEKINKTIRRLKKIYKLLSCERINDSGISCDDCPFYPIEHCKEWRSQINNIIEMKGGLNIK